VRQAYKTLGLKSETLFTSQHRHKKPQGAQRTPPGQLVIRHLPVFAGIVGGGLLLFAIVFFNDWLASGAGVMEVSEWIKVLIVPVVLSVGALLFNRSLKLHELKIAEHHAQEDAVKGYLDHMATLLMEKKLRHTSPGDEASICARAGTLLVMRRVDPELKRNLLLFLCETGVIRKNLPSHIREDPSPVIDLYDADLEKIDLSGCTLPDVVLCHAKLSRANLSNTGLIEADLSGAILKGANLSGANLKNAVLRKAEPEGKVAEANLTGADLSEANLYGATVTQEQLDAAHSLVGATMPDGTKHD
jgi:hypothetical protein